MALPEGKSEITPYFREKTGLSGACFVRRCTKCSRHIPDKHFRGVILLSPNHVFDVTMVSYCKSCNFYLTDHFICNDQREWQVETDQGWSEPERYMPAMQHQFWGGLFVALDRFTGMMHAFTAAVNDFFNRRK